MAHYTFTEEEYVMRANEIKEMVVSALLKEGLLNNENATYFLENYVLVPRAHKIWGFLMEKIFPGPEKGRMKLYMTKIVDVYNEHQGNARPSHAKLVPLNKEEKDE